MQPKYRAQGATEYLVLLAVILIIALVSIALLGFFPGTASEAKETENRIYWQSASPIAITEWGAKAYSDGTMPYFKLKNTGQAKIILTKVLSNSTSMLATAAGYPANKAIYPDEEITFGYTTSTYPCCGYAGITPVGGFWFRPAPSGGSNQLWSLSQCSATSPYGFLVVPGFGFEYTVEIEGQSVTKRQVGATPLTIKCSPQN